MNTDDYISAVIGWVYFIMWSVSFYPQVWENWKRKSVVGLSFDYEVFNIIGFSCYTAYNCAFYWSPLIQKEYMDANDGHENLVQPNDVFFGIHAVILTILIIVQIFIYERGNQKVSYVCIAMSAAMGLSAVIVGFLTIAKVTTWLFFFYWLSYVKLAITFFKYCPQVYMNWKRKSTIGWSIGNVLLDIGGGILSDVQLIFDSWRSDTWTGITGNPVKLLLGLLSLLFDGIFIVQHYWLYRENNLKTYERLKNEKNIENYELS